MIEESFHVLLALLVSRLVLIAILRWQGRRWWCKCGRTNLWEADVESSHNSQHFVDPYSFTHILHGVVFFYTFGLFLSLLRVSFQWRLVVCVILEAVWEAIENSEYVVEKYRKYTVSKGYVGDSVFNSIGDTLCCGLGYFLAYFLGFKCTVVYYVASEIILLFWIRDNLTINVIMLIHPIPAIKDWQNKGGKADKKSVASKN